MGLDMTNASFATSKAGIDQLLSDLKNDYETSKRTLQGDKYKTLVKEIQNSWQGVDADKFLNDLNKQVQIVIESYEKYYREIEKTLNNARNDFAKFQANNAR